MSKNCSLKYCSYPERLEVTSGNAVIMQNIFGTLLQKCSLSEFSSLRSQSVSLLAFWSHLIFDSNQYYPL